MKRIILSIIFGLGVGLNVAYSQFDQLNPAIASYAAAIKTRITHVVNTSLTESQPEGTVGLKLCITREGALKDVRVDESSGQEALDMIAADIVHKAFPFVPFPAGIREPELWLNVPVVFAKDKMVALLPVPLSSISVSPALPTPVSSAPLQTKIVFPRGLEECFRIALTNYIPTKIAREQVDLARLKINEAERNLYPAVSGEYKTTDGKTITDPYESVSYGIQAEQMLIGLSQVRDTVIREKIGLQMAKKNYDKIKNDVRYEVAKAYYELVSQTMLLKHWQEALEDLKPNLELIKRLYEARLAIAADWENVQSQYNLISYQAFSAESAVSLAKLSLLQAMNLEPSRTEDIDIPLEFGFEAQDLGVQLPQCVNMGLRSRPEIELWQMTAKSAKLNEIINRRENAPKFSLATSYGRSGEAYSTQKMDLVDEWSVMGRLTWLWGPSSLEVSQTQDRILSKTITDTTFKTASSTTDVKFSLADRLNYYSANKEAKITYHQSLNELNETRKKVVYEIKEAYLAYARAISGIQTSLARLSFRKNELRITQARTEAGEGSPTELVETKVNLANEKATYLRSLGEYYLAIAALDRATSYQLPKRS